MLAFRGTFFTISTMWAFKSSMERRKGWFSSICDNKRLKKSGYLQIRLIWYKLFKTYLNWFDKIAKQIHSLTTRVTAEQIEVIIQALPFHQQRLKQMIGVTVQIAVFKILSELLAGVKEFNGEQLTQPHAGDSFLHGLIKRLVDLLLIQYRNPHLQ